MATTHSRSEGVVSASLCSAKRIIRTRPRCRGSSAKHSSHSTGGSLGMTATIAVLLSAPRRTPRVLSLTYMSIRVYFPEWSPDMYLPRTPSDEFLTAGGSTTPSDNGASQPAFQHNPTTLSLSGQASRPAFRTQLDLCSFPLPNRLNPVDYPLTSKCQNVGRFLG
jgi:hypothetical protein